SRGHVLVLEHNAGCGQPQRLQLSYEHKGSCVTCLRWNTAGSRLFAADGAGKVSVLNISSSKVVPLTLPEEPLDVFLFVSQAKSLFQSPPSTLMRLDSRVVQLDFAQDRLLASTLTRCYLGDTVREKFTQVGKKLRDGEFGGCFVPGARAQDPVTIYAARPGSRLWENSHRLSSAVFQSTIPPALVFELLDKLDELGETSVAEAVSKALSDACGFDATARPPSLPGSAEPKPKPDRPNPEPSPTIRNHRNGPNVMRDRDALSSPRHVRCHSTEPAVAKAKTPSPKPIRRIPRRGSDPLPPASLSRTASTEKCIPKPKPIKACSPTTSSCALSRVASVPGSRSSSPASAVAAARPQRSRSRSLEAHRRDPESHLAERPSQLSNLGRATDSIPPVPSLVGIGVGSRGLVHRLKNNNNNNNKTVDSQGHSVEDASPADSDGAPEPGCSASEHGNNNNNRRALGSALRTLPVIPASPLESPMSPLDRVDPEVLASMYAEQDMGYESIYQYLNLYTSSMASGAFNMRGAELAQLGNVADLGKLRET
ncbi:unnamed protein product, partial [Ixodes pacificus]